MVRGAFLWFCAVALCALALVTPAQAQTGGPPPDSDFEVTTLARGADKTGEPIAMAVLPDRRVLHTARDGRIFLTTPNATTSLAGTIPVYTHDEDGLQGIAIDDDFATNRWVYVYYAPPLSTPAGDAPSTSANPNAWDAFEGYNQLSRIKLTDAGTLDMATEQKILQVPADRGICCHAGGEIDFDAQGNLYLSTGDDANPFESDGYTPIDERATRNPAFNAQRSSANTNDLRGKLLRIKVNEDGSYSIPNGNLFAPGTLGTRPEIYAMGFRNPFRFAVDDQTGRVYLGDYGPDAGGPNPNRGPGGQVEFNLITEAGNYGWPYCHGKNDAYNDFDFATGVSAAKFNCAAPRNTSPRNTGLVDLPPAKPAWIAYDGTSVPEFGGGSESPMGGETYRFDASNPSITKFPAYYDGKNFAYEFGRAWFRVLTVGQDGSLLDIEPFMDSFDFKQLINAQFGPDGSLYVLDYGTGFFSGDQFSAVYRIDYVQGTRSPVAEVTADRTSGPAPLTVAFSGADSRDPDGGALTYAWDLDGDGTTDSTSAAPTFTYTAPGRYTASLRVTDSAGDTANASVNITAGNTAPTVTLEAPVAGGIFEYGDTIRYRVRVTDPEDGEIDCSRVRVNTARGHNEHSHGDQSLTGCEGQFTIPAAWEDKTQHSYYVVSAGYTDEGVATPGLELTGTAELRLEHRVMQAEFYDAQAGVQNVSHGGAAGGQRVGYIAAGDWIRFDDINLSGIDSVIARVTSTAPASFQLRSGSPTGPLVAQVSLPNTGGVDNYVDLPAVPVTDPGGTHDLYVVFTSANQDLDELTFVGAGASGNASPVIDATATPTSGALPLEVDFSATATDPEGTPVSLVWDFGVPGAPTATGPTASFTYTTRGTYTAKVTATDADGRTSTRTFTIEALPSCGSTLTDQFDGSALNRDVWTRVLREDQTGYRVENGALAVNAVQGDMYGGNTSAENIIGMPAPSGAWEATTKVTLDHVGDWEQAGMFLHASDQNFLKLAWIKTQNDGRNIEFIRQRGGGPDDQGALDRTPRFPDDASDTVHLRMRSDGSAVTAAWSADGQTWTPLGRSQPLDGLQNAMIGISAFNGVGTPATFDSFTLTQSDAASNPDDEFDGTELDACRWSTILREDQTGYRVAGGALQIDARNGDMFGGTANAQNVILQDAPDGGWEAITKVALPQGEEYEQAGLIAHSSDQDFAKLVLIDVPNVGWRAEFGQNVGGNALFDEALDRSGALPAGINTSGIWLRMRSNGSSLSAAWSADGTTWTPIGRSRSLATMPDPRVGLTAFNGDGQPASFDFFRLEEVQVEPTCQTPATPEAGYRMLFDGTAAGLAQWRMAGPGGFALQDDCSILSFGGLGLLYHPESFESYSLKLDWKMAGDDNAGVFVGFPNPGNDPFNAVNQGHEIQIDATDDPSHTTGSIYGFKAADAAARDAALNPPGQWNSYEIVVQGDRIQVFLNGTKINDYTDTDPNRMNAPSLIGLQNHGAGDDVYFRNVQIRELDDTAPAPALTVTGPQDGAVVTGSTVSVTGSTDGTRVVVAAGGQQQEVTPSGGTFSASVPLLLGPNTITVTAYNAAGGSTARAVTVVSRAFGQLVGGLTDPEGDDDGPGTYTYPTNGAFAAGAFDLLGMDVYRAGDDVRFVTKVNGELVNPWGGDKISHQRINIYLGGAEGGPVAALPGTNMDVASPWSAVVVIDGRFNTAGVFAPDGTKIAGGTLFTAPQTREIGITIPASALGGLDLTTARYGTAMFVNGEAGEGIGFVRPVYDLAYWENPPAGMPWIKEYRMGGGAGVWNDTPSHDTDTRDPNAMDVIVGEGQTQAQVLDWQAASPTRLPMVGLTLAPEEGKPVIRAFADPASGPAPLAVTFSATGIDPDGGALTWRWQFPNGTATGSSVSWTFRQAGTYQVTVTATDDEGQTASQTLEVVVGAVANQPPVVEATANKTSGPAELKVKFDAVAADPDGDDAELLYHWDFGDDNGTALEMSPEHTYMAPGTYTATVTVTDPSGASVTDTVQITVTDPPANQAPSVQAAALPQSGPAPLEVLFTAAGTDPDGDALTYAWSFGDGESGTGQSVNHLYTRTGTYVAQVTVTDARGRIGTATVTVTVGNPRGNQAPTVQIAATPRRGTAPLKVTFTAAASDPDGDPVLYEWDFGDGGKAGGRKVSHTYAKAGTYTAKVTVDDLKGGRATAEVLITVTPKASQQVLAETEASSSVALGAFTKRGLKAVVACAISTRGAATVSVSKGAARRLGLRSATLASARVKCAAGKRVTVRLKPSRTVARRLSAERPRALKATLAVTLKAKRGKLVPKRTVTITR